MSVATARYVRPSAFPVELNLPRIGNPQKRRSPLSAPPVPLPLLGSQFAENQSRIDRDPESSPNYLVEVITLRRFVRCKCLLHEELSSSKLLPDLDPERRRRGLITAPGNARGERPREYGEPCRGVLWKHARALLPLE